MLEIAAKNMLRVPATWSLTPAGIGTMAYHQRNKISLAQVLLVAESEDEFWSIADGWAEAQGCDAYTSEMIREIDEAAPVRRSWECGDYRCPKCHTHYDPTYGGCPQCGARMSWEREDWIGE